MTGKERVRVRLPVRRIAAVVFDFNGVLIEDEPWHWQAMRDAVAPYGITVGWAKYKARYLHYDDHNALRRIVEDAGISLPIGLDRLVAHKRRIYRAILPAEGGIAEPVIRLVRAVAARVPVAIVSGAARAEVVEAVSRAGLRDVFPIIVAAEQVSRPKPDPEGYRLAIRRLVAMRLLTEGMPVLAVEDSPGGAGAALAAGLEVLGVRTTYSAARLRQAGVRRTVARLDAASVEDLLR